MKFNPEKHHRKSMRLKHFDYTTPGIYFITICTYKRELLFGEIIDSQMILNPFGKIVDEEWKMTPEHRASIQLDVSVVMPNHFHGIIQILGDDRSRRDIARHVPSTDTMTRIDLTHGTETTRHVPTINTNTPPNREFGKPIAGSLSTIIGAFKSAVTKRINDIEGTPGMKRWQSRFHDHIVRDNIELSRIRNYIINNPQQWEKDKFNL